MNKTTPVISLHSLTKKFNGKLAVNDINLCVQQGQTFGFLGANGAGKTTTIKMMLGLIRPTDGEILLFGSNPKSVLLNQVGALFDNLVFYNFLSAYDNLMLQAQIKNIQRESGEIDRLLKKVGLAEKAKTKVAYFSTGMIKRLGLASALLGDPALLILDEPLSNLDPLGKQEFKNLIQQLVGNGHTIFISSHSLSEVEKICDHIAIIHKGEIVSKGPLNQLLDKNLVHIVVDFEADNIAATVLKKSIYVQDWSRQTLGHFHVKLQEDHTSNLTRELALAGASPSQINLVQNSLEDHFLSLIG